MKTTDKVRRMLAQGLDAPEIAKKLKIRPAYVHTVKWLDKKKKKTQPERSHDPKVVKAEKKYLKAVKTSEPSKIVKAVEEMKQALDVIEKPKITRKELLDELMPGINACFGLDEKPKPGLWDLIPADDPVNHPPHYKAGGFETIDFIEAKDLNYRLGNVVKYVSRAGKKNSDPIQDLEKAAWYLQREITARKNA